MKLLHIIIKDIKNVVYDWKSLAILVVMPVVIMTILGFSLKGTFSSEGGSGINVIHIAVVKEYDEAKEREKFIEAGNASSLINVDLDVMNDVNLDRIFFNEFMDSDNMKEFVDYMVVDGKEIESLMAKDAIAAAVYLPEDFVFDGYMNFLSSGRNEITIKVVANPDYSFSSSIINSIMEGFSDGLNLQKARFSVFIGDIITQGKGAYLSGVMENMPEIDSSGGRVSIAKESVNEQEAITSFQYYAAAIMSMFLLYAASFGGKAILAERKKYTLARMTVAGFNIYYVVISNFVRIVLLCMMQSSFMIVFSNLVLDVKWGSGVNVLISMVLLSVTVGAIGMLLSVITLTSGNYHIANFFEFVIIQFMALVGGSFIQLEILPEPVRKLSFLSISGQGIKMYTNAMYDLPISANMGTYGLLGAYFLGVVVVTIIYIEVKGKQVNPC